VADRCVTATAARRRQTKLIAMHEFEILRRFDDGDHRWTSSVTLEIRRIQ